MKPSKTKTLTLIQQGVHRARIFRALKLAGFTQEPPSPEAPNGYFWRRIPNQHRRLCVSYEAKDLCLGGNMAWCWQTADLNVEPAWGYTGSTHSSAIFGTCEHVMDITIEAFYTEGFVAGVRHVNDRTENLRKAMQAVLELNKS